MRTTSWRAVEAVGLLLLGCILLQAQNDPNAGVPTFATTVGGAYDTVDLATSGILLRIPLRTKAGKLPFSYSLVGNSHAYVWANVNNHNALQWAVSPGSDFQFLLNGAVDAPLLLGAHLHFDNTTVTCGSDSNDEKLSNFVIIDSSGTSHGLGITLDSDGCFSKSATVTTGDGSGLTAVITGVGGTYTLYDRAGNHTPAVILLSAPSSVVDPDGISASVTSTTSNNGYTVTYTYTDSLSTTPMTAVNNYDTTTGFRDSDTYKYLGGDGVVHSATVTYQKLHQKTNFLCTGINDIDTSGMWFPTAISLADGEQFTLSYEGTPSFAGDITGRLAKITLPTGGYIQYAYSGGNSGINCSSHVVPTLKRTVFDGTNTYNWTYVNGNSSSNPGNYAVTVTDPGLNQTVYNFSGQFQTQAASYQGAATGTPLKIEMTCYNNNLTNCPAPSFVPSYPITQTDVYTNLNSTSPTAGNLVETTYDSFGDPTSVKKLDWGQVLISQTFISYGQSWNGSVCSAYPSGYIQSPCYSHTENSANADVAKTQITYSNAGHPTAISRWNGSSWLTTSAAYNANGTTAWVKDPQNNQTSFSYTGTGGCSSLLLTGTTYPNGSTSQTWDCNGGVVTSNTDLNSKQMLYAYSDPVWRMTSETDQEGNVTHFSYPDSAHLERSLTFNGGSSSRDSIITVDGIGRTAFSQMRQSPGSSTFDSVQLKYGWNSTGPFGTQSVPYAGSEGQGTTAAVTTTQFDAIGRVSSVTGGGGAYENHGYTGKDVLNTLGPSPSGENLKQRQMEYDGLGRLASVCELTGTANGGGSCAQSTPQTGFWTKYSYDPLDHLTGVTQNAQGTPTQSRTLQYDSLGRLTQESNPESGTTTYTYDSDAQCGSAAGDLVKRVDADGTTTCYTYDSLHRVTSITYPTLGAGVASTPNKYFVYDAGNQPNTSTSVPNPNGRLVEAYTATCSNCSKITDTVFGYSARGEISDEWESTPNSAGYYHLSATYWPHGAVDQLTIPGVPVLTYNVDGEGRVNQVAAASGTNPVTNVAYGASDRPDAPTALTFGSGDNDSFSYNSATGQMSGFQYNVGATPQSLAGALTWNTNLTLGQLQLSDQLNSAATETCTYVHDDLARLASANCVNGSTNIWNQDFSYGSFGNISKTVPPGGTGISFQPTYDQSTNRFTALPGVTPTYDANGNLKYDGSFNYIWDAENRPATLNGFGLTTDALGRIVEKNNNGSYTQYVFSPTGRKIAVYVGQTLHRTYIPLPAGAEVNYGSSGISAYAHADWLGSIRVASSPGRAVLADIPYAPYGETYSRTGTYSPEFTGQELDITSPLYDFLHREQNYTEGRWVSPDPAGMAAADPANPQLWNRYAYVGGSPLNSTDPTGLACYPLEKEVFGSCAGFMNNGVAFGLNVNSFTFLGILVFGPGAVRADGGCVGCGNGFDVLGALFPGSLNTTYITKWLTERTPPNTQYRLLRTFDCFAPGDGVRSSTYSLQGPDASSAVITEHQLNPTMTHDNSGQSFQTGGVFSDSIGPNGASGEKGSIRYFTASINGQNLGVVPVTYADGSTYAYEGIWFFGAQNSSNSQVFVNGGQADIMLPQGTCHP